MFSPIIDDKELNKIKAKREERLVIFSGRLIKEKRIDKWLTAVRSAAKRAKGMKALIIGSGPESRSISRKIAGMQLGKMVKLRDFYRTADKRELYEQIKGARLLLQMSEREGLSIIVLESLALGTPVLVPDYSPIPDEVKRMCIVKDEISIPDAIAEVMNSSDKGSYIKDKEGLPAYSTSKVNASLCIAFRKLED